MKDDSKSMNKVHMALEFAGVILPVEKDEEGHKVVPLKPITEVFGLEWQRQLKRVTTGWLEKRLGSCTVLMYSAGQRRELTCIRLDRVAAYLNSLDPSRIKAAGNIDGADFLERKQEEWDDLIHAYEMAGGMFANREARESGQRLAKVRAFLSVCREKRATSDGKDRKVLDALAHSIAEELGVPYQLELNG